jgi:RNA polymerase sigma-70 factor (ECF subfamily)
VNAETLRFPGPEPAGEPEESLDDLLIRVSRGDEQAFAGLYDRTAGAVYGLARRVVRDPARAEEVMQEVLLQVWRSASRYERGRGSAKSWILTLAHRRAIDAVRHDQASTDRERRYDWTGGPEVDVVDDEVTLRMEHQQVRRCLGSLTDLQREAVGLAYYGGHTYAETAKLLEVNPATVKTRMRDGLIRLRDCLGVTR